ncbi:hypothetical protein AHAS_Ahas18G0161100 [Arachis hypogaea]
MFSRQLPLPKFRNAYFPKFKLGILWLNSLSLQHRLRPTPPPATTIAYPLSLPSSLSSPFLHFFVPACDNPVRGVTLCPHFQAPTSNHQQRRPSVPLRHHHHPTASPFFFLLSSMQVPFPYFLSFFSLFSLLFYSVFKNFG